MKLDAKNKALELIKELISNSASEKREDEIMKELDILLPDPRWSDYIFWSEDYKNEDSSFNYDKFFKKVFDYTKSKEFIRNESVINLVNQLIKKDFSGQSEKDMVNEVNGVVSDVNWMQYIFAQR